MSLNYDNIFDSHVCTHQRILTDWAPWGPGGRSFTWLQAGVLVLVPQTGLSTADLWRDEFCVQLYRLLLITTKRIVEHQQVIKFWSRHKSSSDGLSEYRNPLNTSTIRFTWSYYILTLPSDKNRNRVTFPHNICIQRNTEVKSWVQGDRSN